MNRKYFYLNLIVLLAFAGSCGNEQYTQQLAGPRNDSMDMSEVAVVLPEHDGKEQVEISCVPCHSLRYIEMQPEMSKKSWEKIVTKMIKVYGAPVRDSVAAAQIVDYLVAIKGSK
jgi:cytochrome c5